MSNAEITANTTSAFDIHHSIFNIPSAYANRRHLPLPHGYRPY